MTNTKMGIPINNVYTKNSYSDQQLEKFTDGQLLDPVELFLLNHMSEDYIELWNSLAP